MGRGLSHNVALQVACGKRDEAFEVEMLCTRMAAGRWVRDDPAAKTKKLVPKWDLNESRFYLALDGVEPGKVDAIAIPCVDVEEVRNALHLGSKRDSGPWTSGHEVKTAQIAYRWEKSLEVTPPWIYPLCNCIAFKGGHHRFYLALHYGAQSMPFLVSPDEIAELTRILPSLQPRPSE